MKILKLEKAKKQGYIRGTIEYYGRKIIITGPKSTFRDQAYLKDFIKMNLGLK